MADSSHQMKRVFESEVSSAGPINLVPQTAEKPARIRRGGIFGSSPKLTEAEKKDIVVRIIEYLEAL